MKVAKPNQAMERTATRCVFPFSRASTFSGSSDARPRWPSLILFSLGLMTLDPRSQPKHEIREPDSVRVKELVGKTLLIGVTYESHTGEIIERNQFFGPITEISRKRGIVIQDEIRGGTFALPSDL